MDRGAWRATVHKVSKNRTRLSMQNLRVRVPPKSRDRETGSTLEGYFTSQGTKVGGTPQNLEERLNGRNQPLPHHEFGLSGLRTLC